MKYREIYAFWLWRWRWSGSLSWRLRRQRRIEHEANDKEEDGYEDKGKDYVGRDVGEHSYILKEL